jgi:cytochrome P450
MSTTDDKLHQKQRAQASPAFSGKGIESIIDDHVNKLLSLIRRKYLSSKTEMKVMDLATKVQYFARDVVMDIAIGQPFEDLVKDRDMWKAALIHCPLLLWLLLYLGRGNCFRVDG